MSLGDWFLLGLRLGHALAAMFWLGGGVYFLVALRPAARSTDTSSHSLVAAAQGRFAEWAQVATLVMVATGVVLMFDRLANDAEGFTYAGLLAGKVVAAVVAFWLAGIRPSQRSVRRRGARRSKPELIVMLGLSAFVLGIALSTIYGRTAT